ncbi:hypothetical protein NDU88_001175 [Pleurodeles waltl]|uniref:Uncharacterized protein n=1 Tax=Pleurodeles waltl TaxID=8319 RepID=A0AAV7KVH9_PLEWA|nr:hypothetical protein NDU88_001175 [Pleurodeles waltl]
MQGRRHSKAPGSRAPPSGPGAPVVSPYLQGWGRRARTHLRSPSHRPPRSREHKAFHEQPCSNPQAGGGPPRLPSRGRLAPPQMARGPTPSRVSAHSLSPASDINAATDPRPRGPPAASDGLVLGSTGARVAHTGPRTRSPSICPGGRPRITGEVYAPPEQTDQACAIFGFVTTPPKDHDL